MAEENILRTLDAGSSPYYIFVDRDENTLVLKIADEPQQSIVIDKTALSSLASAFNELAVQFPAIR